MIKEIEVLKAACGADENGIGKAIVRVETKYMDFINNKQKIVEEMNLFTPVLNISRDMRHTTVDVIFEHASDYDLVQLFEMLKRFSNVDNAHTDESVEVPTVQVTIIPNEMAGKYYAAGFHGSWMLTASQVNRLPNSIRFFFDNDTFGVYLQTGYVAPEDEE